MVIAVVWFLLGMLWVGAILAGAFLLARSLPRGQRAKSLAWYSAGVAGMVGSTALVPIVGVWVWVPILFVLMIPFEALKWCLGS